MKWGFFATLGGIAVAFYERLISGELIVFLLAGGFRAVWWTVKGVAQVVVALMVLIPLGGKAPAIPTFQNLSTEQKAVLARRALFLAQFNWKEGDQGPTYVVNGNLWIIERGVLNVEKYVDAKGQPRAQHCTYFYAAPATKDGDTLVKPEPFIAGLLVWPQATYFCDFGRG